jgi:hypothetical protein
MNKPSVYIETSIVSYPAAKLIQGGAVPPEAEPDALHIAVACVHEIDYLLP